ncbi:TetR/AcrR family transcriptional regulator [Rhizobium sp. Rhizsp42]|uniref:TetR/AcrR family transcriptional regulator n=1 Tax=Rhizobium sp. Rhizsp42 TaxID=3243034 RepID=UPI0039AF3C4F
MEKNMEAKTAKRCRGRPQVRSDDETKEVILTAADDQFRIAGYAAASISDIAKTAGVSTKTLYRLFPAKADLFSDVISMRIEDYLLALDTEGMADTPLVESLEKVLSAYGRLTLSVDTVAMTRLVFSEYGRFPELAAVFYEKAIRRTSIAIEGWLKHRVSLGELRIDNIPETTGMLRGMMAMEPQRALMLGRIDTISDTEITARARSCAALFLRGCSIN